MEKPLLALCMALLAACQMTLDPPQPHGYRPAAGAGALPPVAVACQWHSVPLADQPVRLPPGCANDANLLQMVEHREDVLHGRATGPALAEPVGRAAYLYLKGVRSDTQHARDSEQAAQVGTAGGQ